MTVVEYLSVFNQLKVNTKDCCIILKTNTMGIVPAHERSLPKEQTQLEAQLISARWTSFEKRLTREKSKLTQASIIFTPINKNYRHLALLLDNQTLLYVELTEGYPFSPPIISFATKLMPQIQKTIDNQISQYLDVWKPKLYLVDVCELVQNKLKVCGFLLRNADGV